MKAAFISSTLAFCQSPHEELTVNPAEPHGVPTTDWPEHQERPEIPHLPHEERLLRVGVDSGASGTNSSARSMHTNSSTQLAWLRNELSDKLIVIAKEDILDKSFFLETPPNPNLNVRPQTKPLAAVSTRARTRSSC